MSEKMHHVVRTAEAKRKLDVELAALWADIRKHLPPNEHRA
ncbi:MAG: hypothetical protein ACXWQR_02050 [Ktedonobacterales bacterium]